MRTIYIDSDFKCHVVNDGTMTSVETDFFDGKCNSFIEGYRLVPNGKTWTRDDGEIFDGEMICPFNDYSELEEAQKLYEEQQKNKRIKNLEESNAALKKENAMLLECVLEMSEIVYA